MSFGNIKRKHCFWEGSEKSGLMIIGQAPGVEENKKGKPFYRRSGKLLDILLKKARIERKEIFITSVLKCFPQPLINRKPNKEEVKECLPYLERQIDIIGPKKLFYWAKWHFLYFFLIGD